MLWFEVFLKNLHNGLSDICHFLKLSSGSLFWYPKSSSGRKTYLLPKIDYHIASLLIADDSHPVIHSVHTAVVISLSRLVCDFSQVYNKQGVEKEKWVTADSYRTTSISLHILLVFASCRWVWKCRWKCPLVSRCPFELILGIALEALLSWVSQFHKIKLFPSHLHC